MLFFLSWHQKESNQGWKGVWVAVLPGSHCLRTIQQQLHDSVNATVKPRKSRILLKNRCFAHELTYSS